MGVEVPSSEWQNIGIGSRETLRQFQQTIYDEKRKKYN